MPPKHLYCFAVVLLEEGVFVRFQCEGRGYIYSVILLEHCTHISNFFWQQYKYTHGLTLKLMVSHTYFHISFVDVHTNKVSAESISSVQMSRHQQFQQRSSNLVGLGGGGGMVSTRKLMVSHTYFHI
jgi:hypothetical protein